MKISKRFIIQKANLVTIYHKIISLKVNFWKMAFVIGLMVSLFYNYKQDKVIEYYKGEYAFFDSLATVHIREVDSLKSILKSVETKEVIFEFITNNVSKRDQLLYENPMEFAEMYLNGTQKNYGGGE